MRVTLIKPPERSRLNFGSFSLAVLAACVRDIADVKILDLTDLRIQEAAKAVLETEPDLAGVTTMGLSSVAPAAAFLKALRNYGFGGLLIAGGHGASMSPEPLLESGADAVVYGEGELTFRELLSSGISEKVKGIVLLRNGNILKTPPRPLISSLDRLPQPARDLDGQKSSIVLLETSRGCPHGCIFCETSRFHGRVWRARSPDLVVKDVRHLVSSADVIQIADDNFMASPKRALRICELLQDGPLPLFFLFSARSDDLVQDPAVIPALAGAHFLRANIGVETVDQNIMQRVQKTIPLDQHRKAFARMRNAGIYTVASFIVGLPGETEKTRQSYVDAAVELGADAARFIPFQPLPGTPMENERCEPWCEERAWKMTREFDRHPEVLKNLMDAAKQPTLRGSFARASLNRRLREKILDRDSAAVVAEALEDIEFSVE